MYMLTRINNYMVTGVISMIRGEIKSYNTLY